MNRRRHAARARNCARTPPNATGNDLARTWAILTGEYPPQPGGVSDYTRSIARQLALAGDEVHVWAPPTSESSGSEEPDDPGVQLYRLPDIFGRDSLAEMSMRLSRLRPPVRLLVQYVPHAFGRKAMNLPFCLWLLWRSRAAGGERVDVMFHEVAYPLGRGQRLRHNVLGIVTRLMAFLVCRAAERVFVSTTAWEPMVRPYLRPGMRVICLPVPSNLPTSADPARVADVRRRLGVGDGTLLLGHFGTYGSWVAGLLRKVLAPVLAAPGQNVMLLLGRGGEAFAAAVVKELPPGAAARIVATGALPLEQVAEHLAACDLLIQPYPEGVTTRRTSLAAGLALGVPTLTTRGRLTEPLWEQSGAVALAAPGGAAVAEAAERLLGDAAERRRLGEAGRRFYLREFDLPVIVRRLRGPLEGHEQCAPR